MKITAEYLKSIIKEELNFAINEMAVYFDSDKSNKEYKEVYRLDKNFGTRGWLGPNSMMASDMWEFFPNEKDIDKREALSDKLDKLLKKANSQPVPPDDFISKEWERGVSRKMKRPLYFGFSDLKSAEDWFGKKELQELINIFGFNLRKIKAKKAWRSKSKKQIIFIPYTSLDDGEIVA